MQVTAITHRRKPVFASIISQVTPSESSVIKKVAYEPMFLAHLRDQLSIKGIRRVVMHEPLSNVRPVIFLQFANGTPRTEIWRGLQGAAAKQADCGKIVIAVSEDIDPTNTDAVMWSLAYRSNPVEDVHIEPYRSTGHAPKSGPRTLDSTLLIDATLKHPMPPLALPAREYMERARAIWNGLGLPPLTVKPPWHGYSLGDWNGCLGGLCAQCRRRGVGKERREHVCTSTGRPYPGNAGAQRCACEIARHSLIADAFRRVGGESSGTGAEMNELDASKFHEIGRSVLRKEDFRLLTGKGRFGDDFNMPGQAWTVMVRSPHPHARILRIDTKQALAMAGVLAVFTGADCLADGLRPIAHNPVPSTKYDMKLTGPGGAAVFVGPHLLLPADKARYVGEAVAMVVAETQRTGRGRGRGSAG